MATKLMKVNTKLGRGLPRPQIGITIWSQGWKATIIRQNVDEWGNVEVITLTVPYNGVVQPLKAEEIQLKPEGQWSWDWNWFHTPIGVELLTNDRIVYNNVEYKVMHKKDYSAYGYYEYHCIKDWQGEETN